MEAGVEIAVRFLGAVEQAYEFISRTPEAGAPCRFDRPRLEGLRRWPVPGFANHLVFYRLVGEWLEIVRVLHGARDIESLLESDAESE